MYRTTQTPIASSRVTVFWKFTLSSRVNHSKNTNTFVKRLDFGVKQTVSVLNTILVNTTLRVACNCNPLASAVPVGAVPVKMHRLPEPPLDLWPPHCPCLSDMFYLVIEFTHKFCEKHKKYTQSCFENLKTVAVPQYPQNLKGKETQVCFVEVKTHLANNCCAHVVVRSSRQYLSRKTY